MNRTNEEAVRDKLLDYFEKEDCDYLEKMDGEEILFKKEVRGNVLIFAAKTNEEGYTVTAKMPLDARPTAAQSDRMFRFICRTNFVIQNGSFILNTGTGHVSFRLPVIVTGDGPSPETIADSIRIVTETVEDRWDELMRVINYGKEELPPSNGAAEVYNEEYAAKMLKRIENRFGE